jgi:hypothetical protein
LEISRGNVEARSEEGFTLPPISFSSPSGGGDNRHLTLNLQEAYTMLQINLERLPSYQKGIEKGMEEGAHRKTVAVAVTLLAMNFPRNRLPPSPNYPWPRFQGSRSEPAWPAPSPAHPPGSLRRPRRFDPDGRGIFSRKLNR